MSKVYYSRGNNIKNLTPKTVDEDDQIPSVKYVKDSMKSLSDELKDKISDFSGTINYPIASLDVIGKNSQDEQEGTPYSGKVKAEDVITDSSHKFVTQAQLDSFKDKPTMQELNMVFGSISEEIQQRVDAAYVNIMNTPNALQKLKDLAVLIRDNVDLYNIINLCSSKVDKEVFDQHKESPIHMSSNDRGALNILLKLIREGFADWEAGPDDYNFIKNKPTSFKANGGDADTLAGRDPEVYMTSRTEDCVIGYNPDDCDVVVNDDTNDISEAITSAPTSGIIYIQSGKYKLESDIKLKSEMENTQASYIITGSGTPTIINANQHKVTLGKGSAIRNVLISNAEVEVTYNAELDNVYFLNCNVTFNACAKAKMQHCTFENSTFRYMGIIQNSMILFNRGNNVLFNYVGGNNVVLGNQTWTNYD